MKRALFACAAVLALAVSKPAFACEGPVAVCERSAAGSFPIIVSGGPARVISDPADWPGVIRAAQALQGDVRRAAGGATPGEGASVVIVGTLGRNAVIDRLAADGRLDMTGVAGVWEGFVQQVVDDPMPGVPRALVIAGADKRGAVFGAYDISERIGVSPWSWWADVPVTVRPDLSVSAGRRVDAPRVRYRGIFLNDEAPALTDWATAAFGGLNHQFYEHVFDLILRLKGNFLWPAMWGKSIADDDPMSPLLADAYGVVLGTSHHEPLTRAHVEWERYGTGPWNFRSNGEALEGFWRDGMERRGDLESLVTVGMRGDGDEAMVEGTAIPLLEEIVASQRRIIADVTGRPAEQTPQVWALYKEVQNYYDEGMQVPDDVTLLFADDNWGNIRRLPEPGRERTGGAGVYFHFDYVGGPRNYKWLNTTQVERTWEQMRLADQAGADRLWIVNVGDLKPMEAPIDFFLDQAWDPEAMTVEAMDRWTGNWATAQFGPEHGPEIGDLIETYTRYNSRRKPELIGPDTFSLTHDGEAERIVAEWDALAARADAVRAALRPEQDAAFVQLAWFPIQASATLTKLHVATGRNRLFANQGRWRAAEVAALEVRALFARDAELEAIYESVADGKWAHMMDQTHISYTNWQQPAVDLLPDLAEATRERGAVLGVAIEGRAEAVVGPPASLPVLDRYGAQSRRIELFDRGAEPARFTAETDADWIRLSSASGPAEGAVVEVAVDWDAAPPGRTESPIHIRDGAGLETRVMAVIDNPPGAVEAGRFVEADGHVAVEAAHFSRAVNGDAIVWQVVPNLGRLGSAVTTTSLTATGLTPGGEGPRLEYDVHLWSAGQVEVQVLLSPTLDFRGRGGLRYAVSIDGGPPQIVTLDLDASDNGSNEDWDRAVADNVVTTTARLVVDRPGPHTIKLWAVDSGLVFQRLVLTRAPLPPTYLGPVESLRFAGRAPGPEH